VIANIPGTKEGDYENGEDGTEQAGDVVDQVPTFLESE